MNYYYITGASSGIGKALAERILKEKDNKVIGMSRSHTIKHPNYLHLSVDLSKISVIRQFRYEKGLRNPERIVLVNNAGTLGDVRPVGKMNTNEMITAYNLNLVAPAVLMNQFMKTFGNKPCPKVIVNISSGAGKYPVDGWGLYCSTKAGIDLFSQVIDLEQKKHSSGHPFQVFAVSPGIVDTPMQDRIREMKEKDFSRVEEFRKYKKEGALIDPDRVAENLYEVMQRPSNFKKVMIDFRK